MEYTDERDIAELAVQRAALLTKRVFVEKSKLTSSKDDKSPVTIGDFGAQALIINTLKHRYPDDAVVAEEEASLLRENQDLRAHVMNLVQTTKLHDEEAERKVGGSLLDEQELLDVIDRGGSPGGEKGRIWALDPIDGTKGFIRGGQYAICLALIVDGEVKVGAMACPNLKLSDSDDIQKSIDLSNNGEDIGVLMSAVAGQGVIARPLGSGRLEPGNAVSLKGPTNVSEAVLCESVEASHSSHDDNFKIAKKLGITRPGVRLDSQAKYAVLAQGIGDIYLRLPVRKDYEEKIWDHAAGTLLVLEAGGEVTDSNGKSLDFSRGRTLKMNKGVIAAARNIHVQVLDAVKKTLQVS